MSEFLGEASVLIRPDTTKFRATLVAELEAATKGIIVPVQVVASTTGTAGIRAAEVATADLTSTRQRQAAVDAIATKQEVDLAAARQLASTATERLAAVEQAGILTTTELAASKAKLRAAEAAVIAARKANVASLAVENTELRANTAATLQTAEAEVVAARAAAIEAASHAKASGSVAAHAAAEHALARGAAATGLSLIGARGATLAASGAFLAGAATVTLLEKSVHEFSREQEAAARVSKVFGDEIGKNLEANAQGLAESFGLSARAALDFEGRLGNTFKNAGFANEKSAQLSEQLVKLAADMAAFANVPVEATLKAITLGLVGNSRGLRQYQVELNQARVAQEALKESGKDRVKDLTRQEIVQARVNLLLQQTTNQQGTAAARSGDLAQEEKKAAANAENLAAALGKLAAPVLVDVLTEINLVVGGITKLKNELGSLGLPTKDSEGHLTLFGKALQLARRDVRDIIFPVLGAKDAVTLFKKALDEIRGSSDNADTSFKELHAQAVATFNATVIANFERVVALMQQLQIAGARTDFRAASNQLATLQERMVGIKTAGGDAVAQLANLAQQEAKARQEVAAATREANLLPGSPAAQQRRRDAKDTLLGIVTEERSIRQKQADDAKAAADEIARKAQEAADFIKQKLAEATQALLDSFTLEQTQAGLQQTRAERTKSLVDDLAALVSLRTVLQKEIVTAKAAALDAQTILNLEVQLATTNNQIAAVRAQQVANRQARRQAAFDRAAASVDLDISLAQTNKDIRAEIAARQRRITLDQERAKSVRGDIIATKQLRNDIAEQRAAIKALRGDLDKRRKDLLALEFEFLQTQTGFVGTLLSNLLPTSAVAGTVGGGAISTPTKAPKVQPPGVTQDLTEKTQTGTGQRSASSGQMSTLIDINRGILAVLNRLVGQRTHPEAVVQRAAQSASMDFFNW